MSNDTRPTPPSGMPAAQSTEARVLDVLERIESRLEKVENRLDGHDSRFKGQDEILQGINVAMTGFTNIARQAFEAAMSANQKADRVPDETTKMLKSGLQIHQTAIESAVRSVVDNSIQHAVEPLQDRLPKVEASDGPQNEALGAIVDELGIEDKVTLGRKVDPDSKKKPERAFQRLEHRVQRSSIAALVVAVASIISAIASMTHH